MSKAYRERFVETGEAQNYDALFVQGADRTYAFTVLWDFEKRFLDRIVGELRKTHARIDYLDFAAGTGRILAHLENRVDSATGIEIAPAMMSVAESRVERSKLICADITAPW